MGRGGRTAAALLLVAATGGAAVYALHLWNSEEPLAEPTATCTAWLDQDSTTLSAEQAHNAALISAVAQRMGLPARASTIGIATALQESSLYNLDHGDRDSLGLFQQRPSQGWGSEDQVQDPYYSAETFYDALVKVNGWQDMEVTVAAQTVQRSGFPDAYATREAAARLWASALTGHSGSAAIDCDIAPGEGTTAQEFASRLERDLGAETYTVAMLSHPAGAVWLDVIPADGEASTRDALANWAVATAAHTSVDAVVNQGSVWTATTGEPAVEATSAPASHARGVAIRLVPVPVEGTE